MGIPNIKIQGLGRFIESTKNFGEVDQGEFVGSSSNRGVILNSAAFGDSAVNAGVVQGSAIFTGNAINAGSVTTVTFTGSAINTGIVLQNTTFSDSAANTGTINGNVVFSGDSVNRGGVILGTYASDTPGDPYFNNNSLLLNSEIPINLAAEDPYINEVQLLLPGNRTAGSSLSTIIVDSSPVGRQLVCIGNAHVSTAVTKYGTGSLAVVGGGNTASLSGAGRITIAANQPFTVEAWVYLLSGGKHSLIGEPSGQAYVTAWGFGIWDTGGPNATIGEVKGLCSWLSPINGYGGNVVYSGQYPSLSAWTHVAICRNAAGIWSFYMNGVKGQTKNANAVAHPNSDFAAASGGPTGEISVPVIIGQFGGFVTPGVAAGNSSTQAAGFNGYIDDFRITVGTDRYSDLSGFTPPPSMGNIAPYGIVDSSSNNLRVSSFNVTQNSFNPYRLNGWSGLHKDTTSYAVVNSTFNAPFTAIGIGKTTIDMWIYPTEFNSSNGFTSNLIGNYATSGSNSRWAFSCVSNAALLSSYLRFTWVDPNVAGTHAVITAPTLPILKDRWSHVAMTVDADTPSAASINFFVNGQKSSTITANLTTQSGMAWPPSIGNNNSQYYYGLPGYFSNVRITKNQIVYTDPFPLSAIPTISQQINRSNILLLAYSDSTLMNRGLSSATMTLNNVSACSVSPSAAGPTFEYNPRTEGGSVYFLGTDSFLSLSSTALANIGTGNFTIECWAYPMAAPAASYLIHLHNGPLSNSGITLRMNSSRQLIVDNGVVAGVTFTQSLLNLNAWNHIALSKIGATTYVYTNGTLTGSASSITFNAHSMVTVGAFTQAAGTRINFFTGYMANLRLVKNTGLYSTPTITVPTTLVPPISNTAVLLNFGNNITDKTANCTLSAVGSVHYSANQSRYGTKGSLYFNGTNSFLTTPKYNNDFNFGTGNFTIEYWIYPLAYGGTTIGGQIFGTTNGSSGNYTINLGESQNRFRVVSDARGTWNEDFGMVGPNLNEWTHMALVRNGANLTMYKNGLSAAGISNAAAYNYRGTTAVIGKFQDPGATRYLKGYLADLRVTKGIARYTTNFTPPSATLPVHQ